MFTSEKTQMATQGKASYRPSNTSQRDTPEGRSSSPPERRHGRPVEAEHLPVALVAAPPTIASMR